MFVWNARIILKTCGTTTLLKAVPRLLEIAKEVGLTSVDNMFYSRKKFMFPEKQLIPHSSFTHEVRSLFFFFFALTDFSHRTKLQVEFLDGVFGKLHNNLETEGSTSSKFGSPSTHPPIIPTKFHVPPLKLAPITIKLSSLALNFQSSLITDFSHNSQWFGLCVGKVER